jgi:phosphate-selective porin
LPRIIAGLIAAILLFGASTPSFGEGAPTASITHGDKGFEFVSPDGRFLLQFQSRLQFRYAYPFDTDPATHDDFDRTRQQLFKVNRARVKIGGHAYKPWLGYFWEYELIRSALLDFRLMLTRHSRISLKVGQWKVHYNRERVISSGRQQMADRSLINPIFTIDRQQGVSMHGRLRGGGAADFSYWFSILTGTGRAARNNDDKHLMWMVRGQWNLFGRVLDWSGSDIEHHEKPAGLIALAAVTNRSPYTRFSQEGGGDLAGYGPGEPGQYRVNQALLETALMVKGFSWQQEFHWKEIDDRVNGAVSRLTGNYLQFGYVFHHALGRVSQPIELAFRHAFYNPDPIVVDDFRQEFTLAGNCFFNGHLNKLTAEVSHFVFDEPAEDERDGWRFRLQWDISI